jgi:hypothetical protein
MAREQRAEHVDHALGLVHRLQQPRQRAVVPLGQVVQPRMQAAEGLVGRRQHEHVVRYLGLDLRDRRQPVGHRIRLRLGGRHRHIRRDARQHLVAADQ